MPEGQTVPAIEYGHGIISKALDVSVPYAVVTMDVPWSLVRGSICVPPSKVVEPTGMSIAALDGLARSVPDVELVFGIGGGMAHDSAKYVTMQQGCRLIQIPTMIGGDAALTPCVGIREDRLVRYIGSVPCEQVVVDFDILQSAPKDLVRVGACDCLSSMTAMHDWRCAVSAGQAVWDGAAAQAASQTLDSILRSRLHIRDCTPQGIRTVFDGFAALADIARELGSDRAQEGSEHFLAYFIEYLTRRTFVHGQLLALCLAAVSCLFGESPDRMLDELSAMGISSNPTRIGISQGLLVDALVGLQDFVASGGYYYSCAHGRKISRSEAVECVRRLAAQPRAEE